MREFGNSSVLQELPRVNLASLVLQTCLSECPSTSEYMKQGTTVLLHFPVIRLLQ